MQADRQGGWVGQGRGRDTTQWEGSLCSMTQRSGHPQNHGYTPVHCCHPIPTHPAPPMAACSMSGIFRDSFQNVVELLDDCFQVRLGNGLPMQ